MRVTDIPTPEIYLESNDFRFFLKWFEAAITKVRFDTENILDLFDPLRCPEKLLWMLADTMGYRYDDRLPPAFCRLVLLYFMSMIKYKGSKSGVTLAAEVNLAQFNIENYGKEKDILNNRLEDTSVPVNSAYVTSHTAEGFIDVVYFSENKPVDACIEYVRPLGMYCFQHAGVSVNARTKISVDARLANINDAAAGEGITRVGHYSRNDYARMQKMYNEPEHEVNTSDTRQLMYRRNSVAEAAPAQDAGYRALSSLQMCNNEHIVKSLIPTVFDLGYGPQDVEIAPHGLNDDYPAWNLRYHYENEFDIPHSRPTSSTSTPPPFSVHDILAVDEERTKDDSSASPIPAINPIMGELGDAMLMKNDNSAYTRYNPETGEIEIYEVDPNPRTQE